VKAYSDHLYSPGVSPDLRSALRQALLVTGTGALWILPFLWPEHRIPLTWLLENAGASIRYRTYRELAPDIIEDRPEREGYTNHERVLRSCETCVERLATDWHYFAKPTKTLFNDIRVYFPMSAQLRVYKIVDRYMTFARDYFAAQRPSKYQEALMWKQMHEYCGSTRL